MGVGTQLPQLITETVEWDVTAEVIVVGFGIAGACAAISAAEAGARVPLLERTGAAGLSAASNRAHSAESMEGV